MGARAIIGTIIMEAINNEDGIGDTHIIYKGGNNRIDTH